MRTKILLWAAAIAAAGTIASNAQVFSVNAVGYVNKTIPKGGLALLSNPLIAPTNSIAGLFNGQVPSGFQVYLYDTNIHSFRLTSFDTDFGWDPEAVSTNIIKPGQGFFVKNPTANDVKVTFVGEVPTGTITTPLVPGLQIVSSPIPQEGSLADPTWNYTPASGDAVYAWDVSKQAYNLSTYDTDFGWDPAPKTIPVGEAFFLSKTAAGSWSRTFQINP